MNKIKGLFTGGQSHNSAPEPTQTTAHTPGVNNSVNWYYFCANFFFKNDPITNPDAKANTSEQKLDKAANWFGRVGFAAKAGVYGLTGGFLMAAAFTGGDTESTGGAQKGNWSIVVECLCSFTESVFLL